MRGWISVKIGLPGEGVSCIALQRSADIAEAYPKYVQWDGVEWVDIDGTVVPDVIGWQQAPAYDIRVEQVISKLAGCVENDKCENKNCCYFTALDELERLLEYIENTGGNGNG